MLGSTAPSVLEQKLISLCKDKSTNLFSFFRAMFGFLRCPHSVCDIVNVLAISLENPHRDGPRDVPGQTEHPDALHVLSRNYQASVYSPSEYF